MSTLKQNIFLSLASVETMLRTLTAKRLLVLNESYKSSPKVSIIIVVYNSLPYVKMCIESLQMTKYSNFEIIVVDNASERQTRTYLDRLVSEKKIQKVYHQKENKYFSGANNIGAHYAASDSSFVLLLNSDTQIKDRYWLSDLIAAAPQTGVISYGNANLPFRPDGWCFLITKKLFEQLGGINEIYKMNWGITDLTKRALHLGAVVKVVLDTERYIHHFGGKSYTTTTKNVQNEPHVGVASFLFDMNWLRVRALNFR